MEVVAGLPKPLRPEAAWPNWTSWAAQTGVTSTTPEMTELIPPRSLKWCPFWFHCHQRVLRFLEQASRQGPLLKMPGPEQTWRQRAPAPRSVATQDSHLLRRPQCTLQLTRQKQGDSKA